MARKWKIAGINFDHMHMGDLLRMVDECPDAEIAGVCDEKPERMRSSIDRFAIPQNKVFDDYRQCLEASKPDLVILCPATAEHALWTERVAPYGAHVLVEKPFAANLAQADAMIEALQKTGKQLVVNWPLRWYPPHITTKRLIDEGAIGALQEVHYYDGNQGPLCHREEKIPVNPDPDEKNRSWWYKKGSGGGSLLDYLGYGVTLGTWFHNGKVPSEVMCMAYVPEGLEVDEHSVTVARYDAGLSKFETRWGTFTDPWTHQPQPKCGFVVKGTEGTIASYDYASTIRVQTRDFPLGKDVAVDAVEAPFDNPVNYVLRSIENGLPIDGPLSPEISRKGQQIVDTAYASAQQGKALPLVDR